MAKYVLLVNLTEQGIRNIKDSAKRLDAGKAFSNPTLSAINHK
jgi:uncharacterized protein with GYD domain